MREQFSCELLQEAHVTLVEQLDVVNFIHTHGNALHAHAEGEAADLGRVVAVALYEFEDVRVNHAAAEQLDPSALLADAAAFAPALEATDGNIGAGFGEGKERREKARLHAGAEERLHGMVERALEVAEGDVAVYRQALDLMEHGRVSSIGSVTAMHFAGDHHAHRRWLALHGADLDRRGMRAQQQALALRLGFLSGDEQSVLRVARRMVGWKVQRLEVVVVGLDLGPGADGVSHGTEDVDDVIHRLDDGVLGANRAASAGEGDVELVTGDLRAA